MRQMQPERRPGRRECDASGQGGRGFTLVELLVVLLMVALASGLIALTLRSGDEDRLEQEAMRLSALLEAGRAEARANGIALRFELVSAADKAGQGQGQEGPEHFRFVGLPAGILPQVRWLDAQTTARIDGARWLRLGPEPLIGAQRIVLMRGERQVVLATDGLSPFAVLLPEADANTAAATR